MYFNVERIKRAFLIRKKKSESIKDIKMSTLWQCTLCNVKIREDRCKKHHSKVHPEIPFKLTNYISDDPQSALQMVNNTAFFGGELQKDENQIEQTDDVTMVETEKNLVHIKCNLCGNMMPSYTMENHITRKHGRSAGIDDVDTIKTMVDQPKSEMIQMTKSLDGMKSNVEPTTYTIDVTAEQLIKLFQKQQIVSQFGRLRLKDF